MDLKKNYEVAFVGLKEGVHHFNFEVDDQFFSVSEKSLLKSGKVNVSVQLDKRPSFIMLQFNIKGMVQLNCDRCDALLDYPLKSTFPILVKYDDSEGKDRENPDADVMYINRGDSHLQLYQLIYEFISLSIPFNHVTCDDLKAEKPCNEEVLRKLEAFEESAASPDLRWEELSKFKFN
jgi:uncharacterized metal-binding protein YceD (DUF177 family)